MHDPRILGSSEPTAVQGTYDPETRPGSERPHAHPAVDGVGGIGSFVHGDGVIASFAFFVADDDARQRAQMCAKCLLGVRTAWGGGRYGS